MFEKVLIANRGEIAVRIIRTLKEMGIKSVAVYSTADRYSPHVLMADEKICIGPPPSPKSYMNIPFIISAAEITDADAIHPGYGFLSENPDFAQIVEECGMRFIGPAPETMRIAGDKIASKNIAKSLGIPVPSGSEEVKDIKELKKAIEILGLPVILKASLGGGGRGMRSIYFEEEMESAFDMAMKEAESAFNSKRIYVEKFFENVKHVEVQIIGDGRGNVVHFGTRDCSVQRRHQKVIEEAPFIGPPEVVEKIERDAVKIASHLKYRGAGTVEFLYVPPDRYYFIEINARIQVEHPVSEEVTGYDLIKEQIISVAEERLRIKQEDVKIEGHSIEVRINAEDPETFHPTAGVIKKISLPGGPGVRIDSGIMEGNEVTPHYDPLLLKLIVKGRDRNEAIARLNRALSEIIVEGVKTNIPLIKRIIGDEEFLMGKATTNFMKRYERIG
jgi:acetyl-CoA carboxylase biotin carboxylase subunit